MISLLFRQLRHSFMARLIHLHWRRHRLTMENTIRYKPEVETVSQTESSNKLNLATETDVNALPMFLGARFSLVYKPTLPDASFTQKFKDSRRIPVTGSSYNFATETDINVISMQCRRRRKWIGRARILCRSRWDHADIVFRRKVITNAGIRVPSWSFRVKEASGEVSMYIIEKLAPQNIGIATEIVSISVSVAELLVLPVWDTVSTSGLHPMLFSDVRQCWHPWKWIGRALKHCCSSWDPVDIVFRRKVINYFRYPSAILEFLGEGSIGQSWHVHHWKTCSLKHRYSHWDCVDICFPCWVISTSGLGLFLLPVCTWCCSPKSDDVSTGGSGSDMPENCVVAAYITFISLLFSSLPVTYL